MSVPIIQAPMAGTSTPALAAAVCEAGGLGSIAIGAVAAAEAEQMISRARSLTDRPFNVNVFCHRPARPNPAVEAAWINRLTERYHAFGGRPPAELREIYTSFIVDDAMLEVILRQRPSVVSFHFGLPPAAVVAALRAIGTVLLSTVTSVAEAELARVVGVDALVAQGYEAGGHRGVFDPDAADDRLTTAALVRLLVQRQPLPVIAAGGVMDGAGIAAMLSLGAAAVQMGTAFIGCPESTADAGFRNALASDAAFHTTMTRVISGRPARCLPNAFTGWGEGIASADVPDYPIAYDAGKALNAAAKAAGDFGYGAQWAGQGAPLARALPAAELMRALAQELSDAGWRPDAGMASTPSGTQR
ncbi:MAG: 2-nitropropane dioxygenase [Phycisphaerales bacterium]|nr:2-nitropropane dioxygenase [Phycisphaerales bacterium]